MEHHAFEGLRTRRERKARRSRVTAATFSLVLAAAAIGGALLAFGPRGSGTATRQPAAGPSVDLSVGLDQYAYEKTVSLSYGPEGDGANWPLYVLRASGRQWYRADDSGRRVENGALSYFTAADRTAGEQMGETWGTPIDRSYDPGQFPSDSGDLSGLSTDPNVLRAQLLYRGSGGGASPVPDLSPGLGQDADTPVIWAGVQTLLASPNSSPALRAALFEVASQLKGVNVTEATTDPVGRPATELSQVDSVGIETDWWFDPSSEQLLAQRDIIRNDRMSMPNGTAFWLMIVEESGVADSTDGGATLVKTFVPAPLTQQLPDMPDPRH
jgi:hypothetical protein